MNDGLYRLEAVDVLRRGVPVTWLIAMSADKLTTKNIGRDKLP